MKRTQISHAIAGGVLHQAAVDRRHPWILFAPYVGPKMGEFLAGHGVN